MGPRRKPDIYGPGSSGSSNDETFTLLFVFGFLFLCPLLHCCPTLQMSFVVADPVIVAPRNKATICFFVVFPLVGVKAV